MMVFTPVAAREAALWLDEENLTVEYHGQALSRYEVALHSQTGKLTEVGNSQLFETAHLSPQLKLFELADIQWFPAVWAGEYAPRRLSQSCTLQDVLFADAGAS